MLNNVFLPNNIVDIVPTKIIRDKNLFYIVKCVIIDFGEMSFQISLIIPDDNAIIKKLGLSFVVHKSI